MQFVQYRIDVKQNFKTNRSSYKNHRFSVCLVYGKNLAKTNVF
ncbi:hypothetical protein OD90_1084 [Dokdonia sp. Hel_I_53]|nr:hypothetical protein OD90_1084 [Dokdonia sp. Hel_I_53]